MTACVSALGSARPIFAASRSIAAEILSAAVAPAALSGLLAEIVRRPSRQPNPPNLPLILDLRGYPTSFNQIIHRCG